MRAYLKFGGLALSSILTVSLFLRLFGNDVYGISLAIAALCLFEGGAIAWAKVLNQAKGGQRGIAQGAVWFCVVSSVVSSGAEIILGTRLWVTPFDMNFVTLAVIVGALAVNVLGVFAFDQADPVTMERHRELDRQARARRESQRLEDRVLDASFAKADGEVAAIAGDISDRLARELRDDAVGYLLAQTRGGDSTARAVKPALPRPAAAMSYNAETDPVPVMAPRATNGTHKRAQAEQQDTDAGK